VKFPAVFLDRDGTINVDKHFVHRIDQWEWIPGAVEAIRGFNQLGFRVIVVSNQAGIARGYYTEEDVRRLHEHVRRVLEEMGARVDAFYFCPHHPDLGPACPCRKPLPGLLLQAQRECGLDLSRSFMIGDKVIDVLAGRAAGANPLLVETGYGRDQKAQAPAGTVVVPDLPAALEWIQGRIAREGRKA
jgi:D-glycero-D-manno-heptose 1,7-bisphosphate phosphatase